MSNTTKYLTYATEETLNKYGITTAIPYDKQDEYQDEILKRLHEDGMDLMYVKDPTNDMIITAIKSKADAIQFVVHPTVEQSILAIQKSHGQAFKYVNNPSNNMCIMAIMESTDPEEDDYDDDNPILTYIDNPSYEMVMLAVSRGCSLKFVENQTADLCRIAIMNDPDELQFVVEQTEDLCILAVQKDCRVLEFVREQTDAIIQAALTSTKRRGWSSNDIVKYIR